MIGESATSKTAQIAVQASLTGHLCSRRCTPTPRAGAITRLRDMGIEPFLLSSSLIGVLAQRLSRAEPDSKQRSGGRVRAAPPQHAVGRALPHVVRPDATPPAAIAAARHLRA